LLLFPNFRHALNSFSMEKLFWPPNSRFIQIWMQKINLSQSFSKSFLSQIPVYKTPCRYLPQELITRNRRRTRKLILLWKKEKPEDRKAQIKKLWCIMLKKIKILSSEDKWRNLDIYRSTMITWDTKCRENGNYFWWREPWKCRFQVIAFTRAVCSLKLNFKNRWESKNNWSS